MKVDSSTRVGRMYDPLLISASMHAGFTDDFSSENGMHDASNVLLM